MLCVCSCDSCQNPPKRSGRVLASFDRMTRNTGFVKLEHKRKPNKMYQVMFPKHTKQVITWKNGAASMLFWYSVKIDTVCGGQLTRKETQYSQTASNVDIL